MHHYFNDMNFENRLKEIYDGSFQKGTSKCLHYGDTFKMKSCIVLLKKWVCWPFPKGKNMWF